ncbi:MAG: hypothetical protein O3A15_05045 [Proteobacteria bacterium]|nr:hypothetical protein [Pseudomonadota bacterium]
MIKLLILINFVIIAGCSSINTNELNKDTLLDNFKNSKNYQIYKSSNSPVMTVIKSYRIKELNIIIAVNDSGEAKAFEEYIKEETNLTIFYINNPIPIN